MKYRSALQQLIAQAMKKVVNETLQPDSIHLEHPADSQYGDLSCNIAMTTFAKLAKVKDASTDYKNPRQFAEKLVEELKANSSSDLIESISVAGPGFINFTFSDQFLFEELEKVFHPSNQTETSKGKGRAVVEFSSPNIAKPFTIGHLRSTIIGHAIANLLEAVGWEVYRDNHLGDWGTQFGKQIYAIKTWGNEDEIERASDPVKMLVELYIKFHEEAEAHPEIEEEGRKWFKKLEEGDAEARRLWTKCIDWSFKEFNAIYQKLSIYFTENNGRGYGESFFEDKMGPVIEELEKKGLLKESESAKLVFFPNDELPPLMILKKDGATLYATRDLATDKFRLEHYGKDIVVVNEVGAEQSEYFQQIYKTEEMLGWYQKGQRIHVKHGLYRFKDKKMSTRKGNVIWLSEVLDEATKRAEQVAQSVGKKGSAEDTHNISQVVGIGALKWNDLKRSSHLDIFFDWNEILSMDGNSGPYVQYAYARCKSVLRKVENEKIVFNYNEKKVSPNEEEKTVLRLLYQYREVLEKAAQEFAPHHLCTYLFSLAQAYNTFYNKHHILGEETEQFRLALTSATASTLQKGLKVLGIETVEQM